MSRIFAAVVFLYKNIQITGLTKKSFWSYHLPHMIECCFYIVKAGQLDYSNPHYNSRIYDGLTRNDFIKGNLILFLYKLKIIKQFKYEDDPDGRGYWIGNLDD
jgi:hypothetical protein